MLHLTSCLWGKLSQTIVCNLSCKNAGKCISKTLIFLHFLGLRLLSRSGLNKSPSSNFGSVKSSVVLVLLVLLASETKRYDWILFTKLFGPNFLKGRCSYHAGFLYPTKLVFFYVLVIIQERVWHRWLLHHFFYHQHLNILWQLQYVKRTIIWHQGYDAILTVLNSCGKTCMWEGCPRVNKTTTTTTTTTYSRTWEASFKT